MAISRCIAIAVVKMLLGLLAIAPAAVKFAETEVALSNLRTHAAVLS
jgi:hypothetical protein